MKLLIGLLLLSAWLLSIVKLSLVRFRYAALIWSGLLLAVGLNSDTATAYSLAQISRIWENEATLNNWCVLVLAQELLSLAFGLVWYRKRELGEKSRRWYYAVLVPSLLIVPGGIWLVALAVNAFPEFDYGKTAWTVVGALWLATLAFGILFRCCRRWDARVRSGLVLGYLAGLLAVFLPLAHRAAWVREVPVVPLGWREAGAALTLAAIVGCGAVAGRWIRKKRLNGELGRKNAVFE